MKTITRVLAGAVLAAGLVGCSASGGSGGSADSGAAVAESAGQGAVAQDAAGRDVDPEQMQRQIITTAHATVEVDDPVAAADRLAGITTGLGGRVDDRHSWTPSADEEYPPSASLTLRIPAEDLSEVISDLDELGSVQEVSQSSEDVTGRVVDLDARIEALETSTDRLREIMADATDSADLLAAESALSERQAELESYQAQREQLGDQVAMSTLTVELQPAEAPAQVRGDGFTGGLATGWSALLSFVSTVLVIAGALVPWVVAIGIPVAAVLLLLRLRRRRRITAATSDAQPVTPAS